jgi:predicted  nucleic acid-binding Zn-ribbon protein
LDIVNDVGESFSSLIKDSNRLSTTVIQQQSDFNVLTAALENSVKALDETGISEQELSNRQSQRNVIIDEINSKYGDYLPNLFDEKTSLNDIAEATKTANTEFIRRIQLLARQEEFDAIQAKAVEVAKDLNDALKNQAKIEKDLAAGREKSGFLSIQAASVAAENEVKNLREELLNLQNQAQEIGRQNIDFSVSADVQGGVLEQIQQLELSLENIQRQRDLTLVTDTEELDRLDAAIELIQNRIKALQGEKVKIAEPTKQILAGTVAFLQAQIKELQEELKFKIEVDDFETRQRILSKIRVLNNQIKAANQAFEVSALLKPDTSEILSLEPVDVPVNLDVPDTQL